MQNQSVDVISISHSPKETENIISKSHQECCKVVVAEPNKDKDNTMMLHKTMPDEMKKVGMVSMMVVEIDHVFSLF